MSEVSRSEEIFHAALGWPRTERAARLDEACGGDAALRARVEELLAAHDAAGDFLDRPAARPLDDVTPGTRLGRYVVGRLLGEGGVGRVFEAEQTEPVRRRVALKVLKLGMDTHEVIARFEAERQALALMDHPGIARVFDAGATPAGRPFFVMELVEGVPLTRHCDEAKLTPPARLELFIRVCQAVQHAHQKGVVHRDLKPSNILVTRVDGVAVPKVIDFGIAKATQFRLTDRTFSTAVAQFVGTPAYMSPEQTELGGGRDVDTRSDVYSLGVLLFELLTGHTPFGSRESVAAGLDDLRRRIREEEPARPSTLLTTIGGDRLALAAAARGLDPARLVRLVRGELDWIVLRCLEKDRNRRYPTANALAEDLRRHLQHEPVNAVAPSAAYILGKFARRYRVAVVVGGLVAAVLVAATAVSLWQARRATRAERLAGERAQAEATARAAAEAAEAVAAKEARAARAIASFLQNDLLAQASPEQEPDRDVRLRVVLDRAAARLGDRFGDDPLVKADLHETTGSTYERLGLYAEAERHLAAARDLRAAQLGPDHPETLRVGSRLASALELQGRYPESEALAGEVAAAQARVLGPDAPDTLVTRSRLAAATMQGGRLREADALQERLVADFVRVFGPDHPETLVVRHNHAGTLVRLGRAAEAEKVFVDVLERRRRVLGPEHPRTLTTAGDHAATLNSLGRHAEALALQRDVLAARERVLGPDHPVTLTTLNSVAVALTRLGQLTESAELMARVRAGKARALGPEHPATLVAASNLAAAWARLDRLAEAEPLAREVAAVRRRVLGPEHPDTLRSLSSLANLSSSLGRLAEAEVAQREVHAVRARVLGPDHPDTLRSVLSLGQILRLQEKWDDAVALITPALAAAPAKLGPDHAETLQLADGLALSLLGARRFAEAEAVIRQALAARERSAPGSWQDAALRSHLGVALQGQGRLAEAESSLLAGEAGIRAVATQLPAAVRSLPALARRRIAEFYEATNRPDEAAKWRP